MATVKYVNDYQERFNLYLQIWETLLFITSCIDLWLNRCFNIRNQVTLITTSFVNLSRKLEVPSTLNWKLATDNTVILTDLGVTDEFGRTPLHNAILGKQLRVVQILLSRGANIQVQDERGDTPIHTAVRVGDERILEVR